MLQFLDRCEEVMTVWIVEFCRCRQWRHWMSWWWWEARNQLLVTTSCSTASTAARTVRVSRHLTTIVRHPSISSMSRPIRSNSGTSVHLLGRLMDTSHYVTCQLYAHVFLCNLQFRMFCVFACSIACNKCAADFIVTRIPAVCSYVLFTLYVPVQSVLTFFSILY